jgi:hypothetical protein
MGEDALGNRRVHPAFVVPLQMYFMDSVFFTVFSLGKETIDLQIYRKFAP